MAKTRMRFQRCLGERRRHHCRIMFFLKILLTLIFLFISWLIFKVWLIEDSSYALNPIIQEPQIFFSWFIMQNFISLSPIIFIDKKLNENQIILLVVVLVLALAGSSITGIALVLVLLVLLLPGYSVVFLSMSINNNFG